MSDPASNELALDAPTAARPSSSRGDALGILFAAPLAVLYVVGWAFELQSFAWFLTTLGVDLGILLLMTVWWLTRRALSWPLRLGVLVGAPIVAIGIGIACARVIQPPPFILMFGLPWALILSAVWVAASRRLGPGVRAAGVVAAWAFAFGALLLIRVNGTQGDLRADIHWRWTPTAEETYLASRVGAPAMASRSLPSTSPALVELQPGDWPAFRGPDRDSVAHGSHINADWQRTPPKVLWRQRVGPAWSSMAVAGGRVFTQEQRGDREAVVCRDADTGREIWAHEDAARFDEAMSGPGPRATPAFADGRVYAQGATGLLNCLDAASGTPIWERDLRVEAGAAAPMWGFCGSPLVADGRVYAFAGGEGKKGLLAYAADTGAPAWSADAGKISYSSPHPFDAGGTHDVLMFTNEGVFAVDRAGGAMRWQSPVQAAAGIPPSIQPCRVAADALVLGHGAGFGTERVTVAPDDRSASRAWTMIKMKPSFSDMVCHGGNLYGFDGTVFCCVDAATGARRWRDGRYGAGQVVLLADQGMLLISAEDGEAVLLRANPDKLDEIARFQAITGKAWNHPAFAHDRFYVRSDAEMACLDLSSGGG